MAIVETQEGTRSKPSKQSVRQLADRAAATFESGDYLHARRLREELVRTASDTPQGREAAVALRNARIDPGALLAGGISTLMVLMAWALVL